MNLLEAMEQRHAIRAYTDEPVAADVLAILKAEICSCNMESGLHVQMASGLEDAFLGLKTHYGRFTGVHNAIALIGRPQAPAADGVADTGTSEGIGESGDAGDTEDAGNAGAAGEHAASDGSRAPREHGDADAAPASTQPPAQAGWSKADNTDEAAAHAGIDPGEAALQEKVGYYGEQLALRAVQLGLETCWAVLDDADKADHPWWCLHPGERIVWVLAFGHGARPAGRRRTKPMEQLCRIPEGMAMPDWFRAGMEAAMLAPTSLSQQPFLFTLHEDGTVSAEATSGLFAHVGLGCAKCHFEIGAGRDNVVWR